MIKLIVKELKEHVPFTFFGAVTGIVLMIFFYRLPYNVSYNIFYVLHPMHVFFSAFVTASLFEIYNRKKNCRSNIFALILIGYTGSVGIATLSDSLIPYIGEVLLNLPNKEAHIGFIEEWWLVNPLAFAGIAAAYFIPRTKMPHAGHVLLSTWASLFHIIMASGDQMSWLLYLMVFIFLFLAVWIPCCLSDIIFPLLFVNEKRHCH
ncbi:hypothetical protein ACFL58_00295 [Elusimicrobiota bacterium]